jgi:Ca-activated chloride channel family protein
VFGFGQGNYNDQLMQVLAQNGNGTAAYIDTLSEAQKTLVDEAESTLFPIAKDVKIQVEFNPKTVAEYRLIGYETRALAARTSTTTGWMPAISAPAIR